MPTSLRFWKDETSNRRQKVLKRVIVVTSLVISNVASYVVGNPEISLGEVVRVIVTTLAQGVLGG